VAGGPIGYRGVVVRGGRFAVPLRLLGPAEALGLFGGLLVPASGFVVRERRSLMGFLRMHR